MKKQKILALLFTGAIAFSAMTLTGCGKKESSEAMSSTENNSSIIDSGVTKESTTADTSIQSTEAQETKSTGAAAQETRTAETKAPTTVNSSTDSEFDKIITNGESEIKAGIDEITNEWGSLKSKITSYATYVSNYGEIENFYEKVLQKAKDLCTIACITGLNYGKAINDSSLGDKEKYKQSEKISKDIYDDLFDLIEEGIYEELFDDIEDHNYEDVLDDSKQSGVDYETWYETRSNEYELWYDTRSDVYEEWYDTRSDLYDFYSDLRSELYSSDKKRVQKVINKFEEKINKRKQ